MFQLLNQMDGFDSLGRTKLIMATNRPDTLDPALLRPGRLDRKIEIPLPNEQARLEILKIHAAPVNKGGDIDYEAIVKVRAPNLLVYAHLMKINMAAFRRF
jgi:26S proteasome regulatory subunit T4